MHQIVVTILCRFAPLSPMRNWPASGTGEPPSLWEALLFVQDLLYESTVFPHRRKHNQRDSAKKNIYYSVEYAFDDCERSGQTLGPRPLTRMP